LDDDDPPTKASVKGGRDEKPPKRVPATTMIPISHGDLIRKRVDRATNFATKVDLVTAQYPVEEREEIAELLRILAAKPEAPDVRL
jgi:hypothetical protein